MNGVNGVDHLVVVNGKVYDERNLQKSYWTEHSVEATVEAMMLDSQAKAIDKEERPEVNADPFFAAKDEQHCFEHDDNSHMSFSRSSAADKSKIWLRHQDPQVCCV